MLKVGDKISQQVTTEVAGEYDVVVCGGGTAGCVAAIAAARNGAKVVLLEGSSTIGGMLTFGNAGLTNYVYHGKDAETQSKITERLRKDPKSAQIVGGIPLEFVHKLMDRDAAIGTAGTASTYVYTDCQEFKILLFEMLNEAGVNIFLRSPVCDVIMDGDKISCVITQTKLGRRAYVAKQFIDTTGDGDVAALSGVPFVVGVSEEDSVYKQGLMPLGALHGMGSMFRIGGVDFGKYIEHIRKHPEQYKPTRAGQMTMEEFIKAYENGEMMNSLGAMLSVEDFEKAKESGELVNPQDLLGTQWFQIYNYPRDGIMVGCLSMPEVWEGENIVNRSALDINDVTRTEYDTMIAARDKLNQIKASVPGFEKAFVLDSPMGIRETRHIIGEYRMNIVDVLNRVEFPDTIGKGSHPIDVWPIPAEVKNLSKPDEWSFDIPYRCMVPKKVSNLLVAGRCASATREAYGCIRPTAQCMVLGEAAGTASAILCKNDISNTNDIDVTELRKVLKDNGVVL